MPDDDRSLASLGIDLGVDYSMPDSVWDTALAAAFDPDTPPVDATLVPEMDGDVPVAADDAGIDHGNVAHHAEAADHSIDHVVDDTPHDDPRSDDPDSDDPHLDPYLDDHGVIEHGSDGHDSQGDHPGDHAPDHDWHG